MSEIFETGVPRVVRQVSLGHLTVERCKKGIKNMAMHKVTSKEYVRVWLENHRNDVDRLFKSVVSPRTGGTILAAIDAVAEHVTDAKKAFSAHDYHAPHFTGEELSFIECVVQFPPGLTQEYYQGILSDEEYAKIDGLLALLRDYCHDAACLAEQVGSDSVNEWLRTYDALGRHPGLRSMSGTDPVDRIGWLMGNTAARLMHEASRCQFWQRLTELPLESQVESEAEPGTPVVPAPACSKFKGKTLKRKDGSWIRVEDDGVTFTCPTKRGDEVKEESYRMDKPAQLEFLDALLDRFEKNLWHKPPTKKSEWQNTLFKRGPAAQFLKDGHIACWGLAEDGRENQGQKGAIRLAVPVVHAKAT